MSTQGFSSSSQTSKPTFAATFKKKEQEKRQTLNPERRPFPAGVFASSKAPEKSIADPRGKERARETAQSPSGSDSEREIVERRQIKKQN